MGKSNSQISQHKRMAMGLGVATKYASGGSVAPLKTGLPTSPITDAKRANGVPGYKAGGKTSKSC